MTSTLWLGAAVDAEGDGQPGPSADGDDLNGATPDDEDGVPTASLTGLTRGRQATVPVSVYNNTGGNATLWGWMDFSANGTAEVGETATATVASSADPQQIVNLAYDVPLNAAANTYARFRVGTVAAEVTAPTGWASNGEVEDYAVRTAAPPTAAQVQHFRAVFTGADAVQLTWSTLVENNLLGFHVERKTGNDEWQRLTAQMIPVTGWNPWSEDYGFADGQAPTKVGLAYRLVGVDLNGHEQELARSTLPTAIATAVSRTGDGLTLALRGAPDSSLVLETTTNLAGPWMRLRTLTLDGDGTSAVVLSVDVHEGARFYRLVSE